MRRRAELIWKHIRNWWVGSRVAAICTGLGNFLLDLAGQWIVVGVGILLIVLAFVLEITS